MRRLRGILQKQGMMPGTLLYIGETRKEKTTMSLIEYDKGQVCETKFAGVAEFIGHGLKLPVNWINVNGIHDVQVVAQLGAFFGIHPLVQEDIVNTNQRPKFEDHGEYSYLVLKTLAPADDGHSVDIQQISLIVGENYIISFQEVNSGIFDAVKNRICSTQGRLRNIRADYLAYLLLDAITDNYYTVLEFFGNQIEELEDRVILTSDSTLVQNIHNLKTELLFLRKSVWPLREVINAVQRGDSTVFSDETRIYIRDIYDHTIQVIDTIEMYRDMVSGLLDIYLSSVNNRLGEVMKVLTIISTIFIPLNFIAGVYGMNFHYMPELSFAWGYPAVLGLMIGVAAFLLSFFRRRSWL
ncbi:magnesium transporter [Dendrosporobacter quercicolus]|uniref:Magnesium transport protein CorA n=1 Tax=Dendrosporobacter quercicolus TaxID=146817 RepID=A0A1G9XT64_9FIRM|nr:magnesium/cobalt transporter CorA [Dendrosporobacter quercicolus]SDM99375.1 magnesium transporter [Dendrosporobacter quercicolus]